MASGKGGTGKTLLATSLAWRLGGLAHAVTYVDADVAEPNGHLFLRPEAVVERRLGVRIPALRGERCSGCGACQRACAFDAIVAIGEGVQVSPERCRSCGVCLLACEEDALVEVERSIGTHRQGRAGAVEFHDAALDVGEATAPPLIRGLLAALDAASAGVGFQIIDAPPGTASNAMWAVRRADHVVLVTEPTPFGLHDLDLAVQMCRGLERPMAVVLNRSDLGGAAARGRVTTFLEQESLPLIAEIPFSLEVARAHARCELAALALPEVQRAVDAVADHLVRAAARRGAAR